MTLDKQAAHERTTLLKRLREEHKDTIESTRALLKSQQESLRER